jgi:hypothetical protein
MPSNETKLVAFKCKCVVSGKVVIDNNILGEIPGFIYLGTNVRNTLNMELTSEVRSHSK